MRLKLLVAVLMCFLAISCASAMPRGPDGRYTTFCAGWDCKSSSPSAWDCHGCATATSVTAYSSAYAEASATTYVVTTPPRTETGTGTMSAANLQYTTFSLQREIAMLLVNNNLGDRKFGALYESPEQETLPTIIMRLRSDLDAVMVEGNLYCQTPEQYVAFLDGKGWRASRLVVDATTLQPIGFVTLSAYNCMPNGDTDHYVVTAWQVMPSGAMTIVFDDQIWLCYDRDSGQHYTERSRPQNSIADSTTMYGI